MNNKYLAYIAVASLLAFSCKTIQKEVKTTSVAEKKVAAVDENTLSDNDKIEFEAAFIEGLKQKMIGNQQAAISLFSKCLQINPNAASAMFELAKIHSGNGDMTSASLLLEKAIKIDPENKWYKVLLAQIYEQGKQFKEAAALYQQLYQNDTENLEYLYMNAALLSSAKQYDQAITVYNELEKKVGINDQISVEKQQIFSLVQFEKCFYLHFL